ncbi:MAG: PAS domain S-box protein, partial [Gammaproteobacteria bacterium]|nr:PAS domain S-box protein [Gammaproteobacteria bacterium]
LLTADIKQTTNFMIVLVFAGYVLPTPRFFYPALLAMGIGWILMVARGAEWSGEIIHYSFAMVMGMMFSVFLHTLRRSQLTQLFDLQMTVEQLNESQKQIATGESTFQNLMEGVPAGILVMDEATRFLFANAAAREITGIGDRDLSGIDVGADGSRLFDRNGQPLPLDKIPAARVARSGDPINNEVFGIGQKEGGIRWILLNAYSFLPSGGDGQLIVTSFVDITERIQAENLLRDSEERAHSILDSVLEGIVTVDQNGCITLINPTARAMTGFSSEDALGQLLTSVVRFVEDEAESYTRRLGDEAPVRQGKLTTRGEDSIDIEMIVSEIRSQGVKLGEVVTLRDIRDQILLEQERATMDKMSSVGILAGGIAHDFNNLLTAIYGNLMLAERAVGDPEKVLELLGRSSESIQSATNLTNQLLTFATGSDPVRSVIDVEKLVREATQFVLSGSSIAVDYMIGPGLRSVEVDEGQMQQAISNIVLNAKQAMNDVGFLTIEIRDRVPELAGYVEVAIADGGPGIDSGALQKIFDPYFTTKDLGTGLGLATTHSIVTKHGGSISVDSTRGEGTCFTLLLPAADEQSVSSTSDYAISDSEDTSFEILVMDDEETVLEAIIEVLDSLGHRVTATRNGAEAVTAYVSRQCESKPYDLVIVDLTVIGGMGGMETAQKILEHDPDAKLVVTSGYSAGAEMARFKELGFKARLAKPFRFNDLEAVVSEVMN